MWWWALIAVLGFLLVTALVIVMARSNTARWERDRRAVPAAVKRREEQTRRLRAAAVLAWRPPRPERRLPHLHLPHVHLPSGVIARLPHPHPLRLLHRDGRVPGQGGRRGRRTTRLHAREQGPESQPQTQDDGTPTGSQAS